MPEQNTSAIPARFKRGSAFEDFRPFDKSQGGEQRRTIKTFPPEDGSVLWRKVSGDREQG